MGKDVGRVGSQPKKLISRKTLVKSKWATIHKDTVLSNDGHDLDYITVERSDSVIIIVQKDGRLIITQKQFRPGINKKTLDFVGGRVGSLKPIEAAKVTLSRELLLDDDTKLNLLAITKTSLYVDSAFSNQKLYGYFVELDPNVSLPKNTQSYTSNELLKELRCLQCRSILLEALNRSLVR